MPRIFISYSHSQKSVVEDLANRLRRIYGHDNVWYDEALIGGEDWWRTILRAINECDIFLFLASHESIRSKYCLQELREATKLHKPIIPCLTSSCHVSDLPPYLQRLQIVNVSPSMTADEFTELERAIQHHGSGRRFSRRTLLSVLVLTILIGVITFWALRNQRYEPEIRLAYEFLVDTSANMLAPLNGKSRYQIVSEAIKQIVSVPGLGASQIWRGLRVAGGGECNQTNIVAQGKNVPPDEFLAPLSQITPGGKNAYEAGINETFEDLNLPEVTASNVKVVFILLGSLEMVPCREFYFPGALAAYKQLGITTTFCTFTLIDDIPGFERFSKAMVEQGFGCVHNVDNPEEINRIAINVIQQEIRREIGQEEVLTPVNSPTAIIYLQPTDTPTATVTSSNTPTEDFLATSRAPLGTRAATPGVNPLQSTTQQPDDLGIISTPTSRQQSTVITPTQPLFSTPGSTLAITPRPTNTNPPGATTNPTPTAQQPILTSTPLPPQSTSIPVPTSLPVETSVPIPTPTPTQPPPPTVTPVPPQPPASSTPFVPPPTDIPTQPPSCSVNSFSISPGSGVVGTIFNISGSGSCNTGVRAIRFKIDGGIIYELGAPSASPTWNSAGASVGVHTATVEVAGWGDNDWLYAASQSAQFTVDSSPPPSCSVNSFSISPGSGVVGTIFNISGSGSCNTGVRAIRFKIDGGIIYELGAPSASPTWNSAGASVGVHTATIEVAGWGDNDWLYAASQSSQFTVTG